MQHYLPRLEGLWHSTCFDQQLQNQLASIAEAAASIASERLLRHFFAPFSPLFRISVSITLIHAAAEVAQSGGPGLSASGICLLTAGVRAEPAHSDLCRQGRQEVIELSLLCSSCGARNCTNNLLYPALEGVKIGYTTL